MKKFAKIAAVVLVAVMALAVLVACAPNSNPEKAIASLKDKGYATTGSSVADRGTLEKAACDTVGITVGVKTGELTAFVTGTKASEDGTSLEIVQIYYFDSSDIAKQAWESTIIKGLRDKAAESDGYTVKLSGSMIYYGTSAAIKAAK